MTKPVEITSATLDQVIESPRVREALHARGRLLLPRAQRIAATADAPIFGKAVRLEEGTRPGVKSPTGLKRPYARITAPLSEPVMREARRSRLSPQKILRRAAS